MYWYKVLWCCGLLHELLVLTRLTSARRKLTQRFERWRRVATAGHHSNPWNSHESKSLWTPPRNETPGYLLCLKQE